MSAPRILVLFGNVPLLGQELGNIEALDALARSGCEVLFLIRREWTRDTIQRELKRRGLPFVFVPWFDSLRRGVSPWIWIRNIAGIMGGSWRLLRLIRSFRATHLHVGSLSNMLNFAPALVLSRLPLVFRVGDLPQSHHLGWRLTWRFARWRTDRFVCVSWFLREQIVAGAVAPFRVAVIYNRPPSRGDQEEELPRQEREPGMHFVYVGQLIAEKGVGLLVDAAIAVCKEYSNVRFSVAGRIEERQAFVSNMLARVKSSGLADRIAFLDYVHDVPKLLKRADVHVCPSLCQEGLGNVVMEAKAAGLPSVIFPSGGLRELVVHSVDGYVCPQPTVDALTAALEFYVAQREAASEQGSAARSSLASFGISDFAAKWRTAYDQADRARPFPQEPDRISIIALFGNVPMLGQERANIETLSATRATGAEVLFLIREEWTKDTIQAALRERRLDFVPVPYFDAFRYGLPLRIWWRNVMGILGGSYRLLRFIRTVRATHLHVGSMGNLVNFVPALMLTGLPVVFRAGDIPPQHHLFWRLMWRYAKRRVGHFVCDSLFIKGMLTSLGADERALSVIYAPAPLRKAGTTPEFARFRGTTFLYVGQISRDKGADLLVQAAIEICNERQDARFLIAGNYTWNNPLGEKLFAQVGAAGMRERIQFLGYVEDIDVLFAVADVHVFPSIAPEAYGLSVIEAMERGVPSIVFPAGGVVELVADGVTGHICEKAGTAPLLDALRYYLRDSNIARRQGMAAKNSLAKFDFPRFGEKWRKIYEQVSDDRSR